MNSTLVRSLSAIMLVVALAACSAAARAPVVGAPTTDVNPITGSRGGSAGK